MATETLKQLSMKVTPDVFARWNDLKNQFGLETTASQFVDLLLERYSNPMKINKENEEKIKKLTEELSTLKNDLENSFKGYSEKEREVKELLKLKEDNQQLKEELQEVTEKRIEIPKDSIIYKSNIAYLEILRHVANRENERTGKAFNESNVINYLISESLIKGNYIPALSRSELNQIRQLVKSNKEKND
jgi:flagellar biosynthesis chaperone FliJ